MKKIFSVWFELPYKKAGNTLLWSCKLYTLILVPYLAFVLTVIFVSFLFGGFFDILGFTRAYFYDGQVLDFISWRVHLTWFVVCVLICLNEEL